ncbi:MAG: hypothetical protein WBA88_23460 [Pseudaminobacter sp.]
MMHEKIRLHHLERKAILYVRQSSAHQVLHNRESSTLHQAVWSAPATDARLKKRIVRTVIREVVADIDDATSEIVLLIHWIGGVHSELLLPKRAEVSAMPPPPIS